MRQDTLLHKIINQSHDKILTFDETGRSKGIAARTMLMLVDDMVVWRRVVSQEVAAGVGCC